MQLSVSKRTLFCHFKATLLSKACNSASDQALAAFEVLKHLPLYRNAHASMTVYMGRAAALNSKDASRSHHPFSDTDSVTVCCVTVNRVNRSERLGPYVNHRTLLGPVLTRVDVGHTSHSSLRVAFLSSRTR